MKDRSMLRRTGFARKVYAPAPSAPLRALNRPVMYAMASDVVVAVPKRKYIRSKALLAAVRALPCQYSGIEGRTEPAHSNWAEHGKSAGVKAHDNRVAALAVEIHRELDQGKRLTYAERRAIWWLAHCRTVRELLRRGMWPADVPVPDISHFDA